MIKSELDAFLALSEFEDSIIEKLSIADPPKTTWTILASASDEEIEHAIEAINEIKEKSGDCGHLSKLTVVRGSVYFEK